MRYLPSHDSPRLKVVACILVKNCEENIASVFLRVLDYANGIIVCDAGSVDMSLNIAEELGALVVEGDYATCLREALRFDPVFVVTIDGYGASVPIRFLVC